MNAIKYDTSTINTLDTLLAKGNGVRGMLESGEDLYEEAFEEWRTGSQDFILEKLGEDSQFYRDFTMRVTEPTLSSCDIGIDTLTAIRRLLEESRPKKDEPSAAVKTVPQEKPKKERTPAAAVEQEKAQSPTLPSPEIKVIPKTHTLQRLDTLIAKGKGVRGMFGSAGGLHEEAFDEWKVSSLDFILEEFGEDSQYYKDFTARTAKPTLPSCNIGIGVLTAIKISLEESFLKEAELPAAAETESLKKPDVKKPPAAIQEKEKVERPEPPRLKFADIPTEETSTVTAEAKKTQEKPETGKPPALIVEEKMKLRPAKKLRQKVGKVPAKGPVKEEPREAGDSSGIRILGNMLWQAQVQLSQEHKDAAAVLCGAVLEEALRWMCSKHEIPVKEWDTVGDLNDKLLSKRVYDESTHNKVVSWWYLREDAQSANYIYEKNDVANMASGLHDFLKDHFPAFAAQNPGGKAGEA